MNLLADYEKKMKPFYDIIGAAYESQKWYRTGLHESVYEIGMSIELKQKGYEILKQEEFKIWYKGQPTDRKCRMDLVVHTPLIGNIIVELKALNMIDDRQRKQLWSYLRLTNTKYGILINFGPKSVYSEKWEYDAETDKFLAIKI
jgi:GxxExxY protein